MKYHFVDNKELMAGKPYGAYDVIMDVSTREVYSVPEEGGNPVYAFTATFLPQPARQPAVSEDHVVQIVATPPVIGDTPVMRVRFSSWDEDSRPVIWPIKHPYWLTGLGERVVDGVLRDVHVMVAYVESVEQLMEMWPEAVDIDVLEEGLTHYTFTERFGFGGNEAFLLLGLDGTGRMLSFKTMCQMLERDIPPLRSVAYQVIQ